MRICLGVAAFFVGVAFAIPAAACSCKMPGAVPSEVTKSTAVFRGTAIDVEQSPVDGDTSGRYLTERATLKVLEVWKGNFKVGDQVSIKSSVGPGVCGYTVRNKPTVIESIEADGGVAPLKISGEWIVFAYGEQPFEISLCSLSKPVEAAGDLASELRELTESNGT